MPQSVLEILLKSRNDGSGARQAKAQLRDLKQNVGELAQGFLGINLGSLTAAGGVAMLGSGVIQATKQTFDMALANRKLRLEIGATAEEMSTLTQVASENEIDVDTLRLGLEGAIKKGYSPTIEGLAQMADAFNAIQDPVAQTAYLFDTFGKSGARMGDLMRLGGAGLKAAAADVQASGAVITGSLEDQALKMDDVVDKWERYTLALKLWVGGGVVTAIGTAVQLTTNEQKLSDVMAQHEQEVRKTAGSYEEYRTEMVRAYGVAGRSVDNLNRLYTTRQGIFETSVILSKQVFQATRDAAEVEDKYSLAINKAAFEQAQYAKNTAVATHWTQIAAGAMQRHEEQKGTAIESFRDLVQGQKDMAQAQEDWQQGAGQKQADLLGGSLYEGSQRYQDGLKAVDEVMGTNLYTTYQNNSAQEKLAQQYASGAISLEKYKEGLQGIKDMPLEDNSAVFDSQTKAAMAFYDILAALGVIDGVDVVATFRGVILSDPAETPSQQAGKDGTPLGLSDYGYGIGGQFGLDVRVPPGFPNDSYGPFWASSGEKVTIATAGQQAAGRGAVTKVVFYGPVTVMPGSNLAAEVMRGMRI